MHESVDSHGEDDNATIERDGHEDDSEDEDEDDLMYLMDDPGAHPLPG